jgi:chromate reductase
MVLAFCDSIQMTAPEAYIQYSPEIFCDDGEIKSVETSAFLTLYMQSFRDFIERVTTVVPQHVPEAEGER